MAGTPFSTALRLRTLSTLIGLTLVFTSSCEPAPRRAVIGFAAPSPGAGAVQIARAELAAAPIPGVVIEVVYDSLVEGDSPDIEVHRAERFAKIPGLVGVVGHGGSRGTLAALPVYDAAGVPLVVPNSTSRQLQGAGPWTFVLPPSDSVEGALLARFAVHGLGARRISIFYINDEYGVGLRDGALLELGRLGATVIDRVPLGQFNDLSTMVEASLTRGRPDVIVVAGTPQMTGLIARAATERIPEMRVVAGDGALVMPDLARYAGGAAGSIYCAAFWAPDANNPNDQAYIARFREVTGRAPLPSATMSRDAIMLLAQAVREAGTDRAAIRRWLEQLGEDRPPYAGVTGAISFRPEAAPRIEIVRVDGESLVPVEFR